MPQSSKDFSIGNISLPWRTRTHGSCRQRGKPFLLKDDPKGAARHRAIMNNLCAVSHRHRMMGLPKLASDEKPVPLKSSPLPPFGYAGGKFYERKLIVEKMPPHKIYVEPFAGAANILLVKPPAEKEVLNDKNPQIMKVHRAIKNRPDDWNMKPSRRKWDILIAKPPSQRSGYEQAYVIEHSYGGKGEAFGYHPHGKTKNMDTTKLHNREKDVVMKDQDFASVMKAHDSKETLHYLDPPYTNKTTTEQYGELQVTPERVEQVADRMNGKVMISYNNDKNVKDTFDKRKWKIQKLKHAAGGLAGGGNTTRTDILITNFDPQKERAGHQSYNEKQD